jgi:uncharacterized protein
MAAFPDIDEAASRRDASLAFDPNSGNWLERPLFNYRSWILAVCALVTVLLGYSASAIQINASFLKTIPSSHPYVLNFMKYRSEVKGLGNSLRIAVEARPGTDIFSREYVNVLKEINDEIYLLPGLDKAYMKSLWMPAVRWVGVTEDGYEGGPVMPEDYDGSSASLRALRDNVLRSGEIGQLVSEDYRSSIIYAPLEEAAGQRFDYHALSNKLEEIRSRYEAKGVKLHITGFAKLMGDLIDGVEAVIGFFAIAVLITAAILYYFTRCLRSTGLVLGATLVSVVWLIGLLPLFGLDLNPYSTLVPFLIFAIGVSHGAQKMNGIMQDIGRGADRLVAARLTFRRLFLTGAAALLAEVVGFGVIALIDIPVIRDVAIIASLGVGILIFTNLAMLPILLSYTGVSPRAAARSIEADQATADNKRALWRFLDLFTQRRLAAWTMVVSALLGLGGYLTSLHLKVGDLDAGAPELRADSRYNRDVHYLVRHYQTGTDVFVAFASTPPGECANYENLVAVERLEWALRQLAPVVGTSSFAEVIRRSSVGLNEGSLKWYELPSNQGMINAAAARAPRELFNATCNLLSIYAYLADHRAESLDKVSHELERFAARNNAPGLRIELAAGNAGIEAATNQVVKASNLRMLMGVYIAVIILCFIVFRSWRAVVCAVVPLMLTSVLVEALMVVTGVGLKVATLPVIALGVGIGVDYALYVLSVTLTYLRAGETLSLAYYRALLFTGRVVIFTACTLAVGVGLWAFSPIKFQGDMGIVLAFMFLWNMLGSLVMLPALAHFLFASSATQHAADNATAANLSAA